MKSPHPLKISTTAPTWNIIDVQKKKDLASHIQSQYLYTIMILFKLGFTPFKNKQPLRHMKLQEIEAQKH